MCNINMVMTKSRKEDKTLTEYINVASYESYQHNSDGDGYFGLGKRFVLKKSKDKIKVKSNNFNFICSHQRWATSGNDEKDVHPFKTDNFVLVHNGVFSDLGNKKKSDTRVFVEMLDKEYNKLKGKNRMVKAIQNTTKQIRGGFSIFVYDRHTKKVYYFKENGTSMYYLENKKYVVMSTKKSNLEYAKYHFGIKEEIMTLGADVIYDVFDNFSEVGSFEVKPYEWGGWKIQETSSIDNKVETKTFKQHLEFKKNKREKVGVEFEEWEENGELYLMEIGAYSDFEDDDWRDYSLKEQIKYHGYLRYV